MAALNNWIAYRKQRAQQLRDSHSMWAFRFRRRRDIKVIRGGKE